MGFEIAGIDTSTKVLQPGYPKMNRDEAGRWALEYLYAVAKSAFLTEAPAHGSLAPAPEDVLFTIVTCSGVELIVIDGDPHNVYMRVMYVQPSARSTVSGSETVRSSSAAFLQRNVDELGLNDAQVAALKDKKVIAVPVFTVSYRQRSHSAAFAWTEANVVDGVGKRENPDGMTTPTADLWLKTERNISEVEGGVEIDDAWTYDENGWDTVIHGV